MNKLSLTKDGSHTLWSEQAKENYHSVFGAIQESRHIFIQAGLQVFSYKTEPINILEIGLGTGLNALLSFQWSEENNIPVDYFAIEAYPLDISIIKKLNYPEILSISKKTFFSIHQKNKEKIGSFFSFQMQEIMLETYFPKRNFFDLIYFDAFSPDVQPEMWTETNFRKLYDSLKPGGFMVTYSTKGTVKRALKSVGFKIEKLPGPPGKREFLRAKK